MIIKDRRTKILLSLFLLSDVEFTPVKLDKNVEVGFDLTFNQKTKGSLSGLVREGMIEKKEGEGSVVMYSLTEKGFNRLSLEFPFFRFLKYTWDGKMRILSYEIPEKKRELRDKLRREVAGWGLGPWHRSFWLTPHPIIENLKELISQKEEEQYVQAFEADHVFGNQEILIEKVWQKASLDKKYRELFKKWHTILSANPTEAQESNVKTEKFRQIISEYVTILKEDPGLPQELMGSNWIGNEAYNIYKEIRSILLG